MVRLLAALSHGGAERQLRDAARYGHEVLGNVASTAEIVERVREGAPDVVFASAAFVTDALLTRCDEVGVRLVASVGSDSERRGIAALGLLETVAAGAPWADIDDLVSGRRLRIAEVVPRTSGTVIAVWGPAGAPGRTSVAIGIASELAAAGHSVALGDVDTHGAAVAPTLGLLDESPGFAAACRLAGAGGLSRSELERIGQRYGSGPAALWVLTGIGRASRWPELSPDRVERTIAECREWVDFTVLDTGFSLEQDEEISSDLLAPRRNGATIAALRAADHVIAVGSADPVGLSRFLRSYGDLVETAEARDVTVVMNRLRASAIGLNAAGQVRQTLARFGGIADPVMVPDDRPAFDAALLAGRTLREVAPRSPARLALQELVARRFLPGREPQPHGRRFARAVAAAN